MSLSTALSHVLVAFTVECDNAFEQRMPHQTSLSVRSEGRRERPWLISMAMWSTCLEHLPDDGITVADLERRARCATNLDGMRRWGYVHLTPGRGRGGTVLTPTVAGRRARELWGTLGAEVEAHWVTRFGSARMEALRRALQAVAEPLDPTLPECLPILGYGLSNKVVPGDATAAPTHLHGLLSRVLLAMAIEFERNFPLSLAICANLLRVLTPAGQRLRDLPDVAGVSKEGLAMAQGYAVKHGYVEVSTDNRSKILRLTERGEHTQHRYQQRLATVESGFRLHVHVLTPFLAPPLPPPPDSWRAARAPRATLPHFPMVLHRGGYPDGS